MSSAIGIGDNLVPGAAGTTVGIPRLGIPRLVLSDGPAGLRIHSTRENDEEKYYCTAFPIGTLLASTWNKELVNEVGRAMGSEALEYGVDLILGPGVNIHRHPLCGRNFEYYSEDPLLTGEMGAAMVNGIESNGVGATPKHFVANNQETSRNINNSIVSNRAMREIYLKGFEIIVKKSQPWAIMSSYNKVNGVYTSESKQLLTDILRNEWGYEGIVMTDWFGGNNVSEQIKAGNDLLEPGTKNIWDNLIKAHEDGDLSLKEIDLSVSRILALIIKSNKMSNYNFTNEPDLNKNAIINRRSASEGMVLLKNENMLPFENIKSVYEKFDKVLDPHSAIGYGAFDKVNLKGNNIVLATAHPCKFPEAIEKAINIKAELPKELSFILDEKENYDIIDNDLNKIKQHIKERI